jgi:hypothetical protein
MKPIGAARQSRLLHHGIASSLLSRNGPARRARRSRMHRGTELGALEYRGRRVALQTHESVAPRHVPSHRLRGHRAIEHRPAPGGEYGHGYQSLHLLPAFYAGVQHSVHVREHPSRKADSEREDQNRRQPLHGRIVHPARWPRKDFVTAISTVTTNA